MARTRRAKTAAVIGGGLGGAAAALGLATVGFDVTVYEAAPSMRREGESISLLANGTAALAALGVEEPVGNRITTLEFRARKSGRRINEVDTARIQDRTGYPYVVIPRAEMLEILLARLSAPVVYAKRCEVVEPGPEGLAIRFDDGSTARADLVVAADGTRSVIRPSLWPDDAGALFSTAWQATVNLPEGYGPADRAILVSAPNVLTGTFPTTNHRVALFMESRSGLGPAAPADLRNALLVHFDGWPSPVLDLLEQCRPDGIRQDEIYARRPPKTWAKSNVFLVGDAAHTLSPSVGQGTNQAFEDAVALAVALRDHSDPEEAGRVYTKSRHRRASAYWHFARLATQPTVARLNEINQALTPSAVATAGWLRLTRPSAVVREVLRAGGL